MESDSYLCYSWFCTSLSRKDGPCVSVDETEDDQVSRLHPFYAVLPIILQFSGMAIARSEAAQKLYHWPTHTGVNAITSECQDSQKMKMSNCLGPIITDRWNLNLLPYLLTLFWTSESRIAVPRLLPHTINAFYFPILSPILFPSILSWCWASTHKTIFAVLIEYFFLKVYRINLV